MCHRLLVRCVGTIIAFPSVYRAVLICTMLLGNASIAYPQSPTSAPPPAYRIYRAPADDMISVIVPPSTTDQQLKALLWYFRQHIRVGDFRSVGIVKATSKHYGKFDYLDGMIVIYRGEKCANETYLDHVGPCGRGEHDDAFYQWGIDGDSAKDSAGLRLKNGDELAVFDYKDGWKPTK